VRVHLREKRQLTLPAEVSDALGLRPGDSIEIRVEEGRAILEPSRRAALDALRAVQKAVAESGVTEEELLESGRQIRKELFRENYPYLAKKYGI
jgi:AbrB family looped-hinge helix DNA binding protein